MDLKQCNTEILKYKRWAMTSSCKWCKFNSGQLKWNAPSWLTLLGCGLVLGTANTIAQNVAWDTSFPFFILGLWIFLIDLIL